MPKEIPECPPKPNPTCGEVHKYKVELITPMFGGGVEPRANDPEFSIRPTAIRGQLQFWWRATVGAKYETAGNLRTAQTEVWGSTERASPVQVQVKTLEPIQTEPCAGIDWDPKLRSGKGGWRVNWKKPFDGKDCELAYALFPFQGETPPPNKNAIVEVLPAVCVHNASFLLTLKCDLSIDFARNVKPAIWAWLNFGGLGGADSAGLWRVKGMEVETDSHGKVVRTIEDFAPKNIDGLSSEWREYVPALSSREWPTLAEVILAGVEASDSISVWNEVVDLLHHFRQGEGKGRNPGVHRNQPRRSRYPEAETIRKITGQRLPKHAPLAHDSCSAFPRAEFGLPIVFHFKDEDKKHPMNSNADPAQTVLYPSDRDSKKRERMASPLILKPLALQNGKVIPIIMRLQTPDLEGVDLRRGETSLKLPDPTLIRGPSLESYDNSPLEGSLSGSAIEAFIDFAKVKGFTEVER